METIKPVIRKRTMKDDADIFMSQFQRSFNYMSNVIANSGIAPILENEDKVVVDIANKIPLHERVYCICEESLKVPRNYLIDKVTEKVGCINSAKNRIKDYSSEHGSENDHVKVPLDHLEVLV